MKPPTYHTPRFTLQAYAPKDENRFVEMSMDSVSVEFMGGTEGIEAEERALFQRIFKLYENEDSQRWFWIWGVYEDDRLCAHLELKETGHTAVGKELEVVYVVHPEERRKGVMTEVLAFLKGRKGEWKRKIIATVSPKNAHSLALLEKWGIERKEWIEEEEDGYWKMTLDD